MLEIGLATTFLSLIVMLVALSGRYLEVRRENRERRGIARNDS